MKKQTERIAYYEEIFDRLSESVTSVYKSIENLENLRPQIDELSAYYSGKQWKKDFADDEAGKIPQDLKRGVLSEDGVNNLLDDISALGAVSDILNLHADKKGD